MASVVWDAELSFLKTEIMPSRLARDQTSSRTFSRFVSRFEQVAVPQIHLPCTHISRRSARVDRIVMVIDEGENTNCDGYFLAELRRDYKKQINENVELLTVGVSHGDAAFQPFIGEERQPVTSECGLMSIVQI